MVSTPASGLPGDMSTSWASAALVGAIVTTGLTAGLLYVFAHSVMPGLATLGDQARLTAFQRIDRAIQNPWMAPAFLGSPVLTAAAGLLRWRDGGASLAWVVAAMALVVVTIVITASVHLPLNSAIQDAAPAFAEAASLRGRLESRWVPWNWARVATSTASLVALCLALLTASHR